LQCNKLYVHYVYKLYDLHVAADDHTEAGFTLKLHAELLSWSDNLLPGTPDSRWPEQFEWQRKEAIYQRIIDDFNRGKVYLCFIFVFFLVNNSREEEDVQEIFGDRHSRKIYTRCESAGEKSPSTSA